MTKDATTMEGMPRNTPHPPEVKARAVELVPEHGIRGTVRILADELGEGARVPTPEAVGRWASERGIMTDQAERTAKATEVAAAKRAMEREEREAKRQEKREALRDLLLNTTLVAANRVLRETQEGTGREAKDFSIALGVVIDKYRLEVGEATGRIEHNPESIADKLDEIERLRSQDELAERRKTA